MSDDDERETLGPYDRVDIPGRDEFGIPEGEHTLTCGCKMKGRALLEMCTEHTGLFDQPVDFTVGTHPGDPGQCPYLFTGKTVLMRCGWPEKARHRHGDWRDPLTNEPAVH